MYDTTTGNQFRATENSVRYGADLRAHVNPDNKSVHWNLGYHTPEYSTTNAMVDTTHVPRVQVCKGQNLKKTNFTLGHETPDYSWKAGLSFEEIADCTNSLDSNEAKTNSSKKQKNIVWGYEESEKMSHYKSQFTDPHLGSQNKDDRKKIKEFVKTLKTSGVHFGHDRLEYTTTNTLQSHTGFVKQQPVKKQNDSSIAFGYTPNTYETTSKALLYSP